MTDVKTIARQYIDLWNERTPQRRHEMLAATWTNDARYADPLMSGEGHDGVDALIAGVQARFPDFRFRLLGEPNGFGEHLRFSWDSDPTAPRRRSRAPTSRSSATARSGASPDSSTPCRRKPDEGECGGSDLCMLPRYEIAPQNKAAPARRLARQWPFCCQVDQPRTVTPRGALRSMQRYRLHLGF